MNTIQKSIDTLVESGAESGLQVAVYRHGELVVDATAGPIEASTPVYSASTGKAVTSTVVHVLVARGVLSYDTPIAALWPEFGAHGKSAATVRHVLTHTVGVPAVPDGTTIEDLCDWDGMCRAIADSVPWWEPGTRTGYHSQTFGWILGEVVRRATGKPISQVLREEIAEPLGIADELYLGVPASELDRVARLDDAPGNAAMLAVMGDFPGTPRGLLPDAAYGNRRDVLAADIPAGGTFSARAVARMYAALLGEVDGVRLLSQEQLDTVTAPAFTGTDQLMGNPVTWALGYAKGRPDGSFADTSFGMVGINGSAAFADTSSGLAFALTKTRFSLGDISAVQQLLPLLG
ncbi:serine hydrolase domain-containing protein [Nonomuraea africana]|uniref:CubicO group peptidase (Beta-lactamase class C family) n=1 Tax=Nonomuraea africana TaxID=46171 RepID=A0ABR9KNT8_9ACTN|nr:serine hydrolase domain-containing protein [Nonomuraea africana]MBE1563680.1 CubicO group peptidase (beta-lactamase class C family) [Nonomuraea africana]